MIGHIHFYGKSRNNLGIGKQELREKHGNKRIVSNKNKCYVLDWCIET